MNDTSAKLFARFLFDRNPKSTNFVPLKNVTFFLGAGFSKAWDKRYPSGKELFTLSHSAINSLPDIETIANIVEPYSEKMTF